MMALYEPNVPPFSSLTPGWAACRLPLLHAPARSPDPAHTDADTRALADAQRRLGHKDRRSDGEAGVQLEAGAVTRCPATDHSRYQDSRLGGLNSRQQALLL